jgi:CheY-like chemotaxis protein
MSFDPRANPRAALRVLLVEDNPGDVLLLEEALGASSVRSDVEVGGDGEAALALLRGAGRFADATRPDIVLLDLSLPGRSGNSILAEIKEDPDLRSLPVVVLTSSTAPEDVAGSYDHYCNTYVIKPMSFADYGDVVRRIEEYWASAAHLPDPR